MSVFPHKIIPFHNLPLNSQFSTSPGVFDFGPEGLMLLAASHFLHSVFSQSHCLLFWEFAGSCSAPFCFHSYQSGSGHCCPIPGPPGGLLVTAPAVDLLFRVPPVPVVLLPRDRDLDLLT